MHFLMIIDHLRNNKLDRMPKYPLFAFNYQKQQQQQKHCPLSLFPFLFLIQL